MILNNNPAIDVDVLMQRVRAEAEQLRSSGAIEFRRGEPRNLDDVRLARSLDRHQVVANLLAGADNANLRIDVPPRLRPFGPLGRFITRVLNYLFKRQREYNANLTSATRELLAMQITIGESVARSIEDLHGLERYRIESFREFRGAIDEFKSQLEGLNFAHHHTRLAVDEAVRSIGEQNDRLAQTDSRVNFAHERVDSAEADIHAISARLTALVEADQVRAGAVSALPGLAARLEGVHERTEFAHRRVDSAEETIGSLASHLAPRAEVRLQIVDSARELEKKIGETQESLLRSLAVLRSEMLAPARPLPAAPAAVPEADDAVHAMIADRFRGSRVDIDERLAIYLPIVRAAKTVQKKSPLLDAGPGRGEWLARLQEEKIAAFGVETNRILAEECRVQGLAVETSDLLAVLRSRAAASLGAITAFHVVEHLPFEYLVDTLRESLRVLVPGGVVIFETPDPRNLVVASQTFYLDPTHLHPVPRELLQALLEGVGFSGCEVLELHPPEHPLFPGDDDLSVRLNAVFSHPLDYALVARAPRS